MFLKIRRLAPILVASTGAVVVSKEVKETTQENKNTADATKKESKPIYYVENTGWERVKLIFKTNEYGEHSPDFSIIMSSAIVGALTGVFIGASRRCKNTLADFMEKNDASKFQNITEARRVLSRELTKQMLRGVWEYCPTFMFLCGGFQLTSTIVAAYRGKTGILEHVAAGATVGALYRFNFGFRGMLVGLTTGAVFGSLYGVTCYLLLLVTGNDLEKSRKDFHDLYTYGERKMRKKEADLELQSKIDPAHVPQLEKLRKLPLTLDNIDDTGKDIA